MTGARRGWRPARRLVQVVQAHPTLVAVAVGAVGIAVGFIGYRQFPAEQRMSPPDALYAAVQLLALSTVNPPAGTGTPLALHIGRLLCALTIAGVLGSLSLRFGVGRLERLRAGRSRGHRVIVGATNDAQQLAVVAAAAETDRRPRRCHTVLIARLDDAAAAALRAKDVVVVDPGHDRQLGRVVRGATDVVIAEHDDLDAIRSIQRIARLVDTTRVPVRVVFRSSMFASTMRNRHHDNDAGGGAMTMVSLAEAVAIDLTSDHHPPADGITREHVIVAGDGELAAEIGVAAIRPWLVPGETLRLDLVGDGVGRWMSIVADELDGDEVQVVEHVVAPAASAIHDGVVEVCAATPGPHLVFVVGLPDAEVVAVGLAVARAGIDGKAVGLLARDVPADDRGRSRNDAVHGAVAVDQLLLVPGWTVHPIASLLEDRDLLRQSLSDRLGDRLLRELAIQRRTHGSEVLAMLLGAGDGGDGARPALAPGGVDLATLLLNAYAEQGWVPTARVKRSMANPQWGDVPRRVRQALLRHHPGPDGIDPMDYRDQIDEIVCSIPRLLGPLGYEFTQPTKKVLAMTDEQIELLAQAIHTAYRRSAAAMGSPGDSLLAELSWEELTAAQQEANRAQARDIDTKLTKVDRHVVSLDDPDAEDLVLTADEVERLAHGEHRRWVRQKAGAGWDFGDPRNDGAKLHPLMVPWADLTEEARELDRVPVRQIAELLRLVRLGVSRSPEC